MTKRSSWPIVALAATVVLTGGGEVWCQTSAPARAPRDAAGPATQRAFDLSQLRKAYATQMMDKLGATENEWNAMEPLLHTIGWLRGSLSGHAGLMGGGGIGTEVEAADSVKEMVKGLMESSQQLGKILQEKDAKVDAIKFALKEYREAKAGVQAELDRKQAELKRLLTPRQEAVLKEMSLLD